MKKVLFATTALVASAGIASAQGVEVSGSAEMGIVGGSGMETQFHQDVEVTFTMSGETDNGLSFGTSVQLDEVGAGSVPTDDQGYAVFISGDFGTLTMGDTDGAFDWALTEVHVGGAIADDHTSHFGFNGQDKMDNFAGFDGQIVRYDHSVGDFSFAVSVQADDTAPVADPIFGLGLKYTADLGGTDLDLGFGYTSVGTTSQVGISAGATLSNGLVIRGQYISYENIAIGSVASVGSLPVSSHMGIGIGYTMDALTIGVNYGQYDVTGDADATGFGLAANYDLGGGAVIQFGYGSGKRANTATALIGDTVSNNTYSLGLAMSF